ncbi:unnamed protein product, partial [Brassica rapa subsp. trilocularis]
GTLPNGLQVAVKRLSKTSGQGEKEFKNEVVLVAKLQHRNLVKLLGYCLRYLSTSWCLIKASITSCLSQLDWTRRYKIVGVIARGILYLHQDLRLTIIHRNLKAGNILLDADMNPKVADFVLVLEIISVRKNSSLLEMDGSLGNLVTYTWRVWNNGLPLELVDSSFRESYQSNKIIRCIHIALLCVQEDSEDRPTMSAIVQMLTTSLISLAVPRPPGFFFRSKKDQACSSVDKSSLCSIDQASITSLAPR